MRASGNLLELHFAPVAETPLFRSVADKFAVYGTRGAVAAGARYWDRPGERHIRRWTETIGSRTTAGAGGKGRCGSSCQLILSGDVDRCCSGNGDDAGEDDGNRVHFAVFRVDLNDLVVLNEIEDMVYVDFCVRSDRCVVDVD